MRIGALFAGYGGLDEAVAATYGGQLAWYAEVDAGACRVLAHRYPGVPNLGDVTTVDWSAVEPVDVLTGGSPCQDLSAAGNRAGMTPGTRSNLWVAMREAIAHLQPALVVWENVRGAFTAPADSALESCPGCVGAAEQRGVVLRALGRVLGDLATIGLDAGWHALRAADIGAPHGRFRVFVTAWPAADPRRLTGQVPPPGRLPTIALPPGNGTAWPAGVKLLPTPTVDDAHNVTRSSGSMESLTREAHTPAAGWDQYRNAIDLWAAVREIPCPPRTYWHKGNERLSPAFVEWMMGLPPGWVTDVPGLTWRQQLTMLGNGVVPQQAAAALRTMHQWKVAA